MVRRRGGLAALNRRELPGSRRTRFTLITVEGVRRHRPDRIHRCHVGCHTGRQRYVEAVHRLKQLREQSSPKRQYGTSQDGFDAEWRMINLSTVEGDLSTARAFDEEDISTPRSGRSSTS